MMIEGLLLSESSDLWQSILRKNNLQAPFLSDAWYQIWSKHFGQGFLSYLLIVNRAILAPFVRKNELVIFAGGRNIADYLDIIGPDNKKHSAWEEILVFLKSQGIRRLELFNIPQSSSTVSFFDKLEPQNNIEIKKEDTTPKILLPKSWDNFLSDLPRRDRHELRRKMRLFESDDKMLNFVVSKNPDKDLETLLQLMKLSPEKKEFLTEDMENFFRQLPRTFPEELILFLLKSGEEVITAMLAFQENKSLLTYNSGFNRNKFPGAGFYLKMKSIQWAIENGFTEYNFLQGNERYKYELGGKDFFVYSVNLQF